MSSTPPPPPPPPPPRKTSFPPPPPPARAAKAALTPPPPATSQSSVKFPPPPPNSNGGTGNQEARPQPTPSTPRAPFSRKTKLGIGALLAAILVAVGVAMVVRQIGSRPPTSLLLTALNREVGGDKVRFDSASQTTTQVGPNTTRIIFKAKGKLSEPLYVATDLAKMLPAEYNATKNRLAEADRVLASKDGIRLREFSQIGAPPEDPRVAVLISRTTETSDSYNIEGEAQATRGANGWDLRITPGSVSPSLPQGRPIGHFGTKAYQANEPKDIAALKALFADRLAYSERILLAAEKFATQLTEERNARIRAFQDQLKPGTIFSGIAKNPGNSQNHFISLEITTFSTVTGSMTAALRNDGGWSESRTFQGLWKADAGAERVNVALVSRQNQAVRSGGPLLETSEELAIDFDLTASGILKAANNKFDFSLQRLTEFEAASLRTQQTSELAGLLSATTPGVVYSGTAIAKNSQVAESILLRFTRQENGGVLLQAVLESPDHSTWQRSIRGTLVANRYRNDGVPLRLQIEGDERVKQAPSNSIFGTNASLSLRLASNSDQFIGEDERYSYRLKRATAAELAQVIAEREKRERRFLNVIRMGAAYDGTARDRAGSVARLRIRVNQLDPASQTLGVLFESRDQNGIYHAMTGSYDLDSGTLQIGSSGQGKFNPSGRLSVPFFSRDQGYKTSLRLTPVGLVGELSDENWSLEFPIGGTTSDSPTAANASEFPEATGTYVKGKDGRWILLPTNGGKITYGAAEVINNISGLIGALSGKIDQGALTRPDKLADLTFNGRDTLPIVSGENVVIVFVGTIKKTTADMVQKHPELADYPLMELAPTRTLPDGRRQVDLLRIVPGLSGFRESRVAAIVDQPNERTLVLTCTSRLVHGTYALITGDIVSEVSIR